MKTKIAAIVIAMTCMFGVNAQKKGSGTPEENAKKQTDKLKTELTLTPEQEKKAYDINLAAAKSIDQIKKASAGLDESATRKKIEPIRKDQDTKIRAILTPEQAKIYDAKTAEARKGHKGGGGQQGKPKPAPAN